MDSDWRARRVRARTHGRVAGTIAAAAAGLSLATLAVAGEAAAAAPAFGLDAASPSLGSLGAEPGEVLLPGAPPAPGPALPPPLRRLTFEDLGLVAGDVPTALSFGRDARPGGILHFPSTAVPTAFRVSFRPT